MSWKRVSMLCVRVTMGWKRDSVSRERLHARLKFRADIQTYRRTESDIQNTVCPNHILGHRGQNEEDKDGKDEDVYVLLKRTKSNKINVSFCGRPHVGVLATGLV